jgi:hypothetical protein
VNPDTVRPRTRALAPVAVRRYCTATLRFRVNDALRDGGIARVAIRLRNAAGRVVKTAAVGVKKVDTRQSAEIKVALPGASTGPSPTRGTRRAPGSGPSATRLSK